MTGSLAYRKNEAAILRGEVPEKYTRLLPYIPAGRIVELGSAEGVLSLLLAKRGDDITAVERQRERHQSALRLRDAWLRGGLLNEASATRHVLGEAHDFVDLLAPEAFDVLVAVRVIYYFGADLDCIFASLAEKIPAVVLCGNKNRAAMWRQGIPDKEGVTNYYASAEGMRALLERHGYSIVQEETEGDPIVVGRKDV